MNVFIDTNILTKLFEVSKENLDDYNNFSKKIRDGDTGVKMWITEQAKREFWKNRDNNLKKIYKEFDKIDLMNAPPLLIQEHDKYDELKRKLKEFTQLKEEISSEVKKNIEEENTKADEIIRRIFDNSNIIYTDEDEIFEKARKRAESRIPPGEKETIGDR
ncbi:MAG: PIN-like domain-containing protein [Flavobacteriales bacterium]